MVFVTVAGFSGPCELECEQLLVAVVIIVVSLDGCVCELELELLVAVVLSLDGCVCELELELMVVASAFILSVCLSLLLKSCEQGIM
jgi:hypothetical protein